MLAMLDTDDLKAVRELERLRIEATRQNDPDVLAPLFHEQLIYVNSAGEVFDKEGYLRAVRTQSLTYDRDFDVRETEVRVLDDVIVLAGSHARSLTPGRRAAGLPFPLHRSVAKGFRRVANARLAVIVGQHGFLRRGVGLPAPVRAPRGPVLHPMGVRGARLRAGICFGG